MKENFPYKIIDVDLDSEHNVVLILREIKNGKNLKIQIPFPILGSIVHALDFTPFSWFNSLLHPCSRFYSILHGSTPCSRFYSLLLL